MKISTMRTAVSADTVMRIARLRAAITRLADNDDSTDLKVLVADLRVVTTAAEYALFMLRAGYHPYNDQHVNKLYEVFDGWD